MPTPKFAPQTRGYNRKQVDAYVQQKKTEYQEALDTMRNRILTLESQLSAALKEGDQAKAKEAKIAKTLLDVTTLAEERKQTVEDYTRAELDRLDTFKTKWTSLATERLKLDDPDLVRQLDNAKEEYRKTLSDVLTRELVLGKDPVYEDYVKERQRTMGGKDLPIHLDELIKKLSQDS